MEKSYQAEHIEKYWLDYWNKNEFAKPKGHGKPYCIMLPPPNVTGTLHMGHGFQITLMDALVRKHRMQSYDVLWQIGSDHAGIATQMVVERQLNQEGKTRHDIGRDAFLERTWAWKAHSGGIIMDQIKQLGASVDWSRERFSMDDGFNEAVNHVFTHMYREGLIYKGQRLVNWDPDLQTALSDLEVINTPTPGHLWTISYPVAGSDETILISTTRPETMLGDTAVAVHPDDDRFKHLIGQSVRLPIVNRIIPIIADDYVDPKFGTGCVKITPAHDFNDYAMGQRHDLDIINILHKNGTINEQAPERYQGLNTQEARALILEELQSLSLLIKTQDHELQIPKGDRSGATIEPLLTDQWFMKTDTLAKKGLDALDEQVLQFVPDNWKNTYCRWLENIQDWCISRQLWWGHRIPAWYDENDQVYVGTSIEEVREHYQLDPSMPLYQDNDVLDTWFSASLWPFATLGWPNQTQELQHFYPTSVLVTGFDIIFFWVARMVMMGLKFTNQVPFHHVYITGLIRDQFGKKMSKSKGNVLDPLDLIHGISLPDLIDKRTKYLMQDFMRDKVRENTKKHYPDGIQAHGTDALRFSFCALANTGRDINFDMSRMGGYRNFCNKLWNAARFILMQTSDQPLNADASESMIDQWILHSFNETVASVNQAFDQYRFDLIAQHLYEFFWNEFCDWYLELAKIQLQSDNEDQKAKTRYTLLSVMERFLRLAHPVIPFITEEIWQKIKGPLSIEGNTIMLASYPENDTLHHFPNSQAEVNWLQRVITVIRTMRSELNIKPSAHIECYFNQGNITDQSNFDAMQTYLTHLCKCDIIWNSAPEKMPMAAQVTQGLEIQIPLSNIDTTHEIARLEKEIAKLKKDQQKRQNKLSNPNYINKAPEEVVNQEKDRLKHIETALVKLEHQLKDTRSLAQSNA